MLEDLVMEIGVAPVSVAVPPLIESAKSDTSRSPLPPFVRYAGLVKVTATVLLSFATATDDMLIPNETEL